MKLTIISDQTGRILATAEVIRGGKDAPTNLSIRPREGQNLHEIEVDDRVVTRDSVAQLYETHRLEMRRNTATLVEVTKVKRMAG